MSISGFGYYGIIQVPYNIVPAEVANACCELALKADSGALAPDLDRETLKETVGAISVEYRAGSAQYLRYRAIDLMLNPYLMTASTMIVRS